MKKNLKKILSLLLAMVMAGTLLACGAKTEESAEPSVETESAEAEVEEKSYFNETGFPICDEPITIKVGGKVSITPDWSKTRVVSAIEEDMGIKFDITTYPEDAWETQLSLMLADDTLPDLVLKSYWDKAASNQAGMDGYLLDISQYLDIMPNLSRVLEEYPDYAAYTKAANGAIYGLGTMRSDDINLAWSCIRISKEDLAKYDLTMEDLSTTDGFYNALKKIKETDPDRIPLILTFDEGSGQRTEWIIRSAFGIDSVNHYYMLGADENNNVFLQDTSDNYKEYLKYMNKLYEEGLINSDAYILTQEELSAKISSKEAVFVNSWLPFSMDLGASDDSWVADYECLVGMKSDVVDESMYVFFPTYNEGATLYVNANTEYPEAICRMIDYAFSVEGRRYFLYGGYEGETYDITTDELGTPTLVFDNYYDKEKYASTTEWRNNELSIDASFNHYGVDSKAAYVRKASDEELEKLVSEMKHLGYVEFAQKELAIRNQCDKEVFAFPFLAYTDEEATERSGLYTDISAYLQQMKAKFITGELDIDAEWDNYVAKTKEIGVDRILEIEQAAYSRYAANLK